MRKSLSRGALKDITNYNSITKKKKSRPTSAKSQTRKSRPGSGKKDSSFRSQNKSKSRDRSKQKVKEHSENHRLDGNLLLKSLKNTHKPSSMAQILGVIDKSDKMKIRPPKAPKNFKMKIEDNLMMNIENINIHNSRSRQLRNLDKKSSTIEQAISKTPNLEFKKDLLKRKSSFANIKRDVGGMNFNLIKGKITTKVKNKTQSFKGFKSLYNTADREFMTNDSNSELYNLTKDVSKKSLLESFNKDKPEIEFVVSAVLLHFFSRINQSTH